MKMIYGLILGLLLVGVSGACDVGIQQVKVQRVRTVQRVYQPVVQRVQVQKVQQVVVPVYQQQVEYVEVPQYQVQQVLVPQAQVYSQAFTAPVTQKFTSPAGVEVNQGGLFGRRLQVKVNQ
jgi:hypothetical protein